MRQILKGGLIALGVASLVGAMALPAGAGASVPNGAAPLTIKKEVDGHVPDGTEFTVRVQCDGPIIFTGPGPTGATSAKIDFDSEGHPDGSNVVTFREAGVCTVTETEDGDAEDVKYECEGQFPPASPDSTEWAVEAQANVTEPCATHGPQESPMTVFIEREAQTAEVTVTNEFPDPEKPPAAVAPQAVAAEPTFTG